MKKVALGMSGGVDSSLCAHLLKEQGYDVTGVYLECWRAPGCRSEEDRKDALAVALSLDIPFTVLDFKDAYKDKVVEYFFDTYEAGLTPNPDVLCNKEIKFGLFYNWAMENGFDYIATGHYAAISTLGNRETGILGDSFVPLRHQLSVSNQEPTTKNQQPGTKYLTIPADKHKDQTYFLYLTSSEQLEHTLFPLATYTKTQVRQEAEKRQIHVSSKKDSVGICFIGDIDVRAFLKERLGEKPGDVVDIDGNVIGTHKGLWFYTIGQRGGFEIFPKTLIKQSDGSSIDRQNIPPFYVIKKLPESNQLVVGFGAQTQRNCFRVTQPFWVKKEPYTSRLVPPSKNKENLNTQESTANNQQQTAHTNTNTNTNPIYVRIRHTGQLIPCTLEKDEIGYLVTLETAIQGIAEGQSAVFYQEIASNQTICLGGGVIS